MIAINESRLKNLIEEYSSQIDLHIKTIRTDIKEFEKNPTKIVNRKPVKITLTPNQINYLELLYNELPFLVKVNMSMLENYKLRFNTILEPKLRKGKQYKEFKDELIKILGYQQLRSEFYPEFYSRLGIKSCVYCNSQLTIVTESNSGQKSAKFQVDHYLSKSDYPCFSISFFNLYPVCSSCNNRKREKEVVFKLYSPDYIDYSSSNFTFSISKKSLVKYRVNGDNSLLKFELSDSKNSGFDESFDIIGIYNTQKDLAAEIIDKSMIYNESYKKILKNSFDKLYGRDPIKFKRMIVGNFTEPHEIHKRPMAKFTQDIARQLKLIV